MSLAWTSDLRDTWPRPAPNDDRPVADDEDAQERPS